MSEQYCRSILRIALAQICQNVGWNSAQSTPLELLTDVLGRYMLQLAKVTHRYSEQFGRTDPNLDDVGLAFRHMGVSISELEEYVRHVEPAPFPHEIVQFPAPKSCNLQIPKPGHKELQTRDEHIEDYMPLLYPTPEDELDNETEKSNDQGEGSAMQVDQGQNGVGGQAEVTEGSNLVVPGDKRPMTSPLEGGLPKKRPRLTNAALPEEAMHSQYEMKSIAITHTGDLTPTKGGKLPDARTPPQGFKKASHDKPSVSKIFRKEKVDSRPSTPLSRPEKVIESSGESQRVEAVGKEREQRVEEIMIYPDGTSKKIPRQKGGGDEVSNSETVSKSASLPALEDKIPVPSPSTKVIPKKKKVGRPRSRSKSPRAPKSPGQGKSPAQPGSSPRGRGRPPKDKTLLKTPEKKKESKNIPVLSTMEEMFASDVLDLSRKPAPPAASAKENVEKKPTDVELPLDLSSKSKEKARGRGRPPLSPEKKRAREMNIDLCIEAVLKMSREGDSEGGAMKEKEVKSERIAEEMSESNQEDTNPAIEDSIDAPPSVTVKREMIEEEAASFDLSEQKKKKKKEKTPKQKEEHPSEEVKDKLKDKLKGKDFVSETVKAEPPEEEVSRPPNVYDFPESPPKPPEQVKKEVTQSPQKMFSVEFVDKEVENKEGEKVKEKSRDKPEKERSKEHKERKKEKKRDKEKKKKNKDKDRDRERKKDKERNKEPDYIPTVSKLKIRIGSSPSSTTVNYMSEGSLKSPPNDSAQNSPRPELKLVIKALPPLSERGSASPQSIGGSTPKQGEKERKKEKKRDKEKKKEAQPSSTHPPPVKQESLDQPLFAPIPISRQETPFSTSSSKSPTPPPPRKPSPPGLFTPFTKTPTPPPRKTPTPPPPQKTPTPPPPRKSPTPPPPKVPTPATKPPTPETDFEPDSDHETEPMKEDEEEVQRFTPSPASTRKTFTPSPSNSPLRSPSPAEESISSYVRSKSNSQSPVRTPSPGRSPSPQPSPPPSPLPSPYRASVSPSNTKPSTPGHMTSRSPSHSPSLSPVPLTIKSEVIPPMPPPSMPGTSFAKPGVQRTVIAETVTTFIDDSGQKVWICPACKMPDDGSPMIGCDICDDWYHWPCVGLKEEPAEEEHWYCSKCMGRNKKPSKRGRGRGRGRGPGRGKKKMM